MLGVEVGVALPIAVAVGVAVVVGVDVAVMVGAAVGVGLIQLMGHFTQIRVAVWPARASVMSPTRVNFPVVAS